MLQRCDTSSCVFLQALIYTKKHKFLFTLMLSDWNERLQVSLAWLIAFDEKSFLFVLNTPRRLLM